MDFLGLFYSIYFLISSEGGKQMPQTRGKFGQRGVSRCLRPGVNSVRGGRFPPGLKQLK